MPRAVYDPRSWGLYAVAVVCVSRGLAYTVAVIPEPLPAGLRELSDLASIKVYGVLWFVAAAVAIYLATGKTNIWAVAFMTGMPTLWGLAYGITWIVSGFHDRSWTTMIIYLCLSVIVVSFGIIRPQRVVTK